MRSGASKTDFTRPNMQLTDSDIDEFQELYASRFDERLSKEEAREKASRLIQLYQIVFRPIPNQT